MLRKILDKQRVAYENIEIEADVKRNKANVNEITEIHLHFMLRGVDASDKKIEKALDITRKNCAMVQSVKDSIVVKETFTRIHP